MTTRAESHPRTAGHGRSVRTWHAGMSDGRRDRNRRRPAQNQLVELPMSSQRLTNLQVLDLRQNQLRVTPVLPAAPGLKQVRRAVRGVVGLGRISFAAGVARNALAGRPRSRAARSAFVMWQINFDFNQLVQLNAKNLEAAPNLGTQLGFPSPASAPLQSATSLCAP